MANQFRWVLMILMMGLSANYLNAQSQVIINPTFNQSNIFFLDQLLQVNVVNPTSTVMTGYLSVDIEDNQGNIILSITSTPMQLGANAITNASDINWQNNLNLANTSIANAIGETGKFPFGKYVFCYRFLSSVNAQVLGINCQEKEINIAGLPELISPYNNANIKSTYPLLTWRPPLPLSGQNVTYNLVLTELKNGQSYIDAIQSNFPLLKRKNLSQISLNYPPDALPLDEEKEYVWQVTAFYNNIEIGQTDIWKFSFKPTLTKSAIPADESYRVLKKRKSSDYYVFNGTLYFIFDNRYNETVLEYTIYKEGNPNANITGLPLVQDMGAGTQKIELNLSNVNGIEANSKYVMKVKDKYEHEYVMTFLYKDPVQ